VIIGDWMSEANMTTLAGKKADGEGEVAYESTFLEALQPALRDIARYGIKVAVNAGGSDVQLLQEAVVKMVKGCGVNLKVAWVEGDDVLDIVNQRLKDGKGDFENICTGEKLKDWPLEPIAAQAYLGGLGIAEALRKGADIVVCGRVSDASPVIGAAYWWHGWTPNHLQELANAFVAGHMIECSNYVCGGNFSGFKGVPGLRDIGYPIAEIGKKGSTIITKQKGSGGIMSEDTCKAQLLYEIQGPWYFNSDVTAILDDICFEQISSNRVAIRGVKFGPPPPTTKIGITARGGFQAEVHWFLVGLDIQEKSKMLEEQIRLALGDAKNFLVLNFSLNGSVAEDPKDQNSATVDFRVFAQARNIDILMPNKFLRPIMDLIMCAYPGGTFHLDFRQGLPKPFYEYFVTTLDQSEIQHRVHLHDNTTVMIPPPEMTKSYPRQQPSQSATTTPSKRHFGITVRGPLGWLVHARSGDKGSNANVGFWVRNHDEYDWMRTMLSTEKIKELLAKEYTRGQIVGGYLIIENPSNLS
jgi:hypothetical protein